MTTNRFIVLYINSSIICKACLDTMETRFNEDHSKIIVVHGDQYYREQKDRCEFVNQSKEVSYKIFEIE